MKLPFSKLIVFILVITVLAACGNNEESSASGDSKEKKVLKMATSADFPPFESRDTKGEFVGFDIELGQIIAKELGRELEIEDMKFDGLVGALQAKRVDYVMSGMSATDKRKKNVDFSNAYHRSGEMFIMKEGTKIKDLKSLKGKTVGVQLGTIQEEGAEKLGEEYGFDVKKIDDAGIIIQELNSNRIDVGYMDKTVAIGYVNEQELVGFDDPTTSSPGMGIAFPKGSKLVADVDQILKELEESGKMDELEDKWLSDRD